MLLDNIQLSDDLEWIDENSWTPVMQDVEYSATGSLLMQESVKQKGRLITLQGTDDMAWITRNIVDSLTAKRNQTELIMNLTLNNHTYKVKFRQNENPVDVSPLRKGDYFNADSYYKVNSLKFIEVE